MAIGAIIILLLAVVFGVAYYSSKNARKTTTKPSPSPTSAATQTVPQQDNSPQTPADSQPDPNSSNLKTYTGEGFQFKYPSNWGILKCNNSINLEFDPNDPVDQLGVSCDRAVKPVTFLVSKESVSCPGELIKLGFNNVIKAKTTKPNGDVNFRWCINGVGTSLDISHRYSTTGARAASSSDYSTEVEQIISTLSFGSGS